MLSSVALFGCMKKSAPANTVPADQEPVISQITLYQVLLQWSESDYTGSKMVIGCNDSLVGIPVSTSIPELRKYAGVRDALVSYDLENRWFTNPRKGQDKISFYSYEIQEKTLIINLKGQLRIAGECDLPRLEETVKAAYKAFGFDDVKVMIDGKPLRN